MIYEMDGEPAPQPDKPAPYSFKRKRAANQRARYLNKRQAASWRGAYDRAGNSTYISLR